jgi:predicted nucleotide-binding protein
MGQADAFIAEISEANPNVMFELGAAFADRRDRPIIQLVNKNRKKTDEGHKMPADLQSMIYIDYTDKPNDQIVDFLIKEIKNDIRISTMLDDKY